MKALNSSRDTLADQKKNLSVASFKSLLLIACGLIAAFLVPMPRGVEAEEWHRFILFTVTVLAVIWQPYPLPIIILLALSIGTAFGIISTEEAFKGYSNSLLWLLIAAFIFARAYVKTGLGRRIALLFIKHFGGSSLRLGYTLAFTDLILAPVTASNTARAGGIVFPVACSLADEFDSRPGPSSRKVGAYLLLTAFQSNIITSAMFLTATAINALCVKLAYETARVNITWGLWFFAALLPGIASLLITPYVIYRTYPPELKKTPEAREYSLRELLRMGSLKSEEKILSAVSILLAVVWTTSSFHPVPTEAAALTALCALLVLGVLGLDDLVAEKTAWGTFIWVGGVLSLAAPLTKGKLVGLFAELIQGRMVGWHGLAALLILGVVYFYLHYLFVSISAQILTLFVVFLTAALAAGAPPLVASLLFCFFSNLYASTTYYGSGPAPIFYGAGYIDRYSWLKIGFFVSVLHLVVWLGIGLPWWRLLGLW